MGSGYGRVGEPRRSPTKDFVIITPDNPTGQVLTRENLEDIIKFDAEKKLFVFADEVTYNSPLHTRKVFWLSTWTLRLR